MVSAYVSSLSRPARTRMWSPHAEVSGVTQAHACLGQPDTFAYVEVEDVSAMADTVVVTIQAIPGPRTTETHVVAPV